MTALCAGHGTTSNAIPGFTDQVVFTSAGIEAALALLGLEIPAAILAPIIAVETLDLTTFCGVDPPADPGLTASDVFDATVLTDPTIMLPAWDKIRTWFKSWYWYSVCQCADGFRPSRPTPSSPGDVSTNPGLPSGTSNNSCWSASSVFTSVPTTTPVTHAVDCQDALLPGSTTVTVTPGYTGLFSRAHVIPAGVQKITFHIEASGSYPGPSIMFVTYNASGTPSSNNVPGDYTNPGSSTRAVTYNLPSTAVSWQVFIFAYYFPGPPPINQGSDWTVNIDFSYTCDSPNTPVVPCCPPDPLLENRINAIMAMLNAIYAGLPASINSLSEGTVHAGISGNGSIVPSAGVIAVKIAMTTIPNRLGRVLNDPTFYFEAGYITTSAAEGNYVSRRITHTPQLFMFEALVDTVHYSIPSDVVASITELRRGP